VNRPPDDRDWTILTTQEAADLLKVPKETLYKWNKTAKGPAFYKIGVHNRYIAWQVMEWFEKHHRDLLDDD
jgi:excisionase family DNA binding protein